MAKTYKIHPAIGFARLGNHPSAFFIGPENSDAAGLEFAGGAESPVQEFKKDGAIKRQAARFRIFEYETDGAGVSTPVREITADEATIRWHVDLVNRKAALNRTIVSVITDEHHPGIPRNTAVPAPFRDTLILGHPGGLGISGKNAAPARFDQCKFKSLTNLYLGELHTDGQGRLLVLGGRGVSQSDPPGAPLPDFANNDDWHDDVSDGPVTATVQFAGQGEQAVTPAWVVVAPPDFAPGIGSIVSLYHVAFQAAIDANFIAPKPRPSFRDDILPLLRQGSAHRWVHNFIYWNKLSRDYPALASTSVAARQLRTDARATLLNSRLRHKFIPDYLKTYFSQYVNGDFDSDLNQAPPVESQPAALDRAGLWATAGLNFFPGIEGSVNLRDNRMYSEPFRLNPSNDALVFPGCLTELMAVPWQADFKDCDVDWWPSQRPQFATLQVAPLVQPDWETPINNRATMVAGFAKLGFMTPQDLGNDVAFVETERDPTLPR